MQHTQQAASNHGVVAAPGAFVLDASSGYEYNVEMNMYRDPYSGYYLFRKVLDNVVAVFVTIVCLAAVPSPHVVCAIRVVFAMPINQK